MSERITKRDSDGVALIPENKDQFQPCLPCDEEYCETCMISNLVDKLAAYEDSGLSPEEVSELSTAKTKGKLIELPCKVGDKVYFIKSMFSYSKSPMEGMVCMIKTFSSDGTFTFGAIMDSNNQERPFTNCDIGKTVFLTKEEAETHLSKARGESHE